MCSQCFDTCGPSQRLRASKKQRAIEAARSACRSHRPSSVPGPTMFSKPVDSLMKQSKPDTRPAPPTSCRDPRSEHPTMNQQEATRKQSSQICITPFKQLALLECFQKCVDRPMKQSTPSTDPTPHAHHFHEYYSGCNAFDFNLFQYNTYRQENSRIDKFTLGQAL